MNQINITADDLLERYTDINETYSAYGSESSGQEETKLIHVCWLDLIDLSCFSTDREEIVPFVEQLLSSWAS